MKPTLRTQSVCIVFALLLSALLGGCVTAPNVDADRSSVGRIRTIALLSIPEPREVPVANMGGAASAFGLVGGLVQANNNLDQAKQYATYLKSKNLDVARHFEQEITQSLKAAGYQMVLVENQRPKVAADGKSDDYSGIHVDADAIMSVWSRSFGFVSPPNSTYYEPSGVVMVRLLDAKSKKDIYFRTFVVGWKLPIKESIYLETDPKYRYKSIDAFVAAEDQATQGLFEAEHFVSQRVANDLRPQSIP